MRYQKRRLPVSVCFARVSGVLDTLEGKIAFQSGDAIVTAKTGESWVVSKTRFLQMYEPDQASVPWADGIYWKKVGLISATRQTEDFQVVIEGGILYGSCGDWLIEDDNEFKWIVSDTLFRDSYNLIE